MKENIHDLLVGAISDSLKDAGFNDIRREDLILDLPANSRFGDLSTNIALRLGTLTKKPSPEIAASLIGNISRRLEAGPLKGCVKKINAEGAGFINIHFSEAYFHGWLEGLISEGAQFLRADCAKKERVLIEFVSANPTGPLSVAHARQAAVGDALANIMSFAGHEVKKEYYLNDEGNQINILGDSVGLRLKELEGEAVDFPENYYQGDYIYDIARKAHDDKPDKGSLGNYAAEYILEIIKKELEDFGVEFDCWYSQKELRKSGKIDEAIDFLKKKGFLYEQDGALWLKSTQFGDDKDRVVIKSDGSYTYLAPDIAYHKDKFKRGFSRLINLWGPDHHGYINRLKAAVKALGEDPQSLSIIIVQLASISRAGKPVHMSTRRGQYITLREVLDEIGRDASRFFFLMRRTSSHLDFDLEVAKKHTPENPVYYVQYAHARICSILHNAEEALMKRDFKGCALALLTQPEELRLMKKLWQFSFVMDTCLNTQDPYMLLAYLQEVAECFHKFYDAHRVLGQAEELTRARLALLQATKTVLASCLRIIGVSRPEKM